MAESLKLPHIVVAPLNTKQAWEEINENDGTVKSVNLILRLFLLEGHDSKEKARIILSKIASAFLTIVQLALIIYYITTSWGHVTDHINFAMDFLSSSVMTIQFINCILSSSWKYDTNHKRFSKAIQILNSTVIDRRRKKDIFYKESRRTQVIVFGGSLILVTVISSNIYVLKELWRTKFDAFMTFFAHYVTFTVILGVLDYLTRLYTFKVRLLSFMAKVVEVQKQDMINRVNEEVVVDLGINYRALCELACAINRRFSFNLVLLYTNVTFTTILATYTTINASTGLVRKIPTERVVTTTLNAVVICALAAWIVQCVVSIREQFTRLQLSLEHHIIELSQALNNLTDEGYPTYTEWRKLQSLLCRRPIQFTAMGFFLLDYSLVANILGTMVTYTVMLIQSNKI